VRRSNHEKKVRQPLPTELGTEPATFRAMSQGFIDTLADLHGVDYAAIGLATLGKPDGFLKRQITGWMARWEKSQNREVPADGKTRRLVSRQHAGVAAAGGWCTTISTCTNLMVGAVNHGEDESESRLGDVHHRDRWSILGIVMTTGATRTTRRTAGHLFKVKRTRCAPDS